ncbi:Tab2/Atab2 family RNA-binding protein [Pseudanabaena galeata UHCC 0370]|uniref:Tab2/Atab2 family RNA-binding protein n=1 Tax=Pseudanabaena galeata UHCC 0370 TaxID=3110310 RepID=A0ABU5TNS4_9CYAN|nr:Tab2/Atab2 family RNA-binding protein [Pseudanabaena galeata]MEA5479993.1 Tab2/Atab2 family RNA-binding protein [Pseudanabaena galeata UHCC 0370]
MSNIWELDFYSRPLLDSNNKKVWELLICDRDRQFEWVRECPSTEVNSEWLAKQLTDCVNSTGQTPIKIRFFRPSMTNIIMRGCKLAGITGQASRRVFTMSAWLVERMASIYPNRDGFQAVDPNPLPLKVLAAQDPKPVPDALMGERWILVSLKAGDFAEAKEWSMDFSELLDISHLDPDTIISGIIIISSRATALAAWMSGVDPVFIKFERNLLGDRTQMQLEASADAQWVLANLQAPKDQEAIAQGATFEEAKQNSQGFHFLAVQTSPDIEHFAGFWMLKEVI